MAKRGQVVLRNDLIEVYEVEVDPLDAYDIHPALEHFPLLEDEEFLALVEDIAEHGQREPIVLTPDHLLLDGRNRVRACDKVGVSVVTRTFRGDAWGYAISKNINQRRLTDNQRAMIAARMCQDIGPGQVRGLASQKRIGELMRVVPSHLTSAKQVLRTCTDELIEAVMHDEVSIYTAFRVGRDLGTDEQHEFVQRLRKLGGDPARVATAMGARSDYDTRPALADREVSSYHPRRAKYLSRTQLQAMLDQLKAVGVVLDSVTDIEPSLDPQEAARWRRDLTAARRPLGQVLKLLKQRQESNP